MRHSSGFNNDTTCILNTNLVLFFLIIELFNIQANVHWATSIPVESIDSLISVYSSVVADEATGDEPPKQLNATICVQ